MFKVSGSEARGQVGLVLKHPLPAGAFLQTQDSRRYFPEPVFLFPAAQALLTDLSADSDCSQAYSRHLFGAGGKARASSAENGKRLGKGQFGIYRPRYAYGGISAVSGCS